MEIVGTLINCKGFDFTDEKTGKEIQGGKLHLGVAPEPSSQNRHLIGGDDLAIIRFDFDKLNKLKALADRLKYQQVQVICELGMAGKNISTKAVDIKPVESN